MIFGLLSIGFILVIAILFTPEQELNYLEQEICRILFKN